MSEEAKVRAGDFSILDGYDKEMDPLEVPSFYRDLNIIQILDKIEKRWGRSVRRFYRYLPANRETEDYRRSVFSDVKKDPVYGALMKFVADMEEVSQIRGEKEKAVDPLQKAVWLIREIECYCDAYELLGKELGASGLSSEGMQTLRDVIGAYIKSAEYRGMREQTSALLEEIRSMRFVLTYDRDRISVSLGEVPGDGAYEEMVRKAFGGEKKTLSNPFIINPYITEFEKQCLDILKKKKPEFFKKLKAVASANADYRKKVLDRFEKEIVFYLSFRTLELEMEGLGYCFAAPGTEEDAPMRAEGLYDLALAITATADDRDVISNDFIYEEGDRFFVLTGPNQGGKTTFARSLGQLVYFTKIGLDVPARSANVHYFTGLQTHFSVEESIETGRGKLKEELVRLVPMMNERMKKGFVVINELFTTAASYDAIIMGKKVLGHFLGLGCMGIYVTHLKELTDKAEGIVSLRAMLDENGIQTFKISRGEADDVPCAENQVNKYRLTYKQLKERL